MRLLQTILLIASSIIASLAYGQQSNFQQYSIEHGLPRSSTYSLCQDSRGFLWVGLDGGGVAVFNGKSFETFDMLDGLPSHNTRAVFEDSKGNIWFGTTAGLCRYDFKDIKVYTTDDGLVHNYVRTLAEDDKGRLWIGTNGGLSVFDGQTFRNYIAPTDIQHNKVRIVLKDHNGQMWVGTDDGICVFWNDSMVGLLTIDDVLPHNTVLELYEDHAEYMWIGTKDGLARVKGDDITIFTEEDGMVSNRIRAISEDKFGNIWIGGRTGVSRFDGDDFLTFTEDNGLSHNRIRDIIQDDQGNMWFGTYFGGLNRFSGQDFTVYSVDEGLISNQVFSIYEDRRGDIIIGTYDGVSKLKFGYNHIDTVINITEADGLTGDRVHLVHKDGNGYYWYGTNFGITISDKINSWPIGPGEGLLGEEVFVIHEETKDQIWAGTSRGISLIKFRGPEDFDIINFAEENPTAFPGEEVVDIARDANGNLWFAFIDGGIVIRKPDGSFIEPALPKEVRNVINLTPQAPNMLWVGTDAAGLYKLNLEQANSLSDSIPYVHFTVVDGLSSNHAYSVLFDKQDNLWMGSQKGLDKISFEENGDISRITHFGKDDGLAGVEIHENACLMDHNGNLWFGTVHGAAFLNTDHYAINTKEPWLHFTDIRVFGKSIRKSSGASREFGLLFNAPKKMEVEHDFRSITFFFHGTNLGAPEKVKYKWKLVGWDDNWSEPSSQNYVGYTNLPPGTYKFMVMSSNEDGTWNEEPLVITVEVRSPFWQQTWFIIVVILVGVLFFFLISQWRVARLRRAKHELESKIALATEELRREKTLVEQKNSEIETQKNELEEAHDAITDSINYARRIQTAIMKPKPKKRSKLRDQMFVFYRPKDIVSGDFYWVMDQGSSSYFAAVDCTGHGVPGAFMSMIGITFLNQITADNDWVEPDEILGELRDKVIDALLNEGSDNAKDGMDIALCRITWDDQMLHFAGANNPVYIISDGELKEIKGDKMPIGDHVLKSEPFTMKEAQLKSGDMVYVFSDGYADQFGGTKGKKFLYSKFKELLIEISSLDLEAQEERIISEFGKWQGEHAQVDDILVMGVRI